MLVQNAAQAFEIAEDKLRAGEYEEALKHYLMVVRGLPTHWRSRFRIADTLLNLKQPRHAFEIYKSMAWHSIKAGHPLWGLVAIKMAAAMDKSQAELVHVVAELYGRNSPRVDRNESKANRRMVRKSDPCGDIGFLRGDKLIEEAARDAASTEGVEDYPDKLPPIPLFSFLAEEAFAEVLAGMQLKRFVKGQAILKEGDPGDAFFILASGDVMVTRKAGEKVLNLARLSYGSVIGEMALIREAPRTATVTAFTDCDLLELKRSFLQQTNTQLQSVTQALHDFTQSRLLANLAATCAIFKPFPRSIRGEIVKKFEEVAVEPGHTLITEGKQGQGLYLVVKGQVRVTKQTGDAETELAVLKEGHVFGEISLIQDTPTTATCRALTRAELLFLPLRAFNSTVARHPEFKTELSKITSERIAATKQALNPDDDDFILIEDDDLIML